MLCGNENLDGRQKQDFYWGRSNTKAPNSLGNSKGTIGLTATHVNSGRGAAGKVVTWAVNALEGEFQGF